jgi:hypothetical protein
MADEELLKLHILAVVPFMILDLIEQGGIKDYHITEAQRYVDIIVSEGDALLYHSKRKGQTARVFHALCRGLAIMAFFPGGVRFLGLHFEEQSGQDLEALFAQLKLEDFEALKTAMEAEEKREEENHEEE